MSTTYRLKASELGGNFWRASKLFNGNKQVEIYIAEVSEEDGDETGYLMSSSENKEDS